jgi:hypothetical protein
VLQSKNSQYNIRTFCTDPHRPGLSNDMVAVWKFNNIKWSAHKDITNLYASFAAENVQFPTAHCDGSFLHSAPTTCDFNTFAMRIHSYIWECMTCPYGKYKITSSTLYSDCRDCITPHCIHEVMSCDQGVFITNQIHQDMQQYRLV